MVTSDTEATVKLHSRYHVSNGFPIGIDATGSKALAYLVSHLVSHSPLVLPGHMVFSTALTFSVSISGLLPCYCSGIPNSDLSRPGILKPEGS